MAATASAAEPARVVRGLSDIARAYDTLLLDQFGVLHDGRTAYPAAVQACHAAAAAGKRLIILSNSGRRSADTLGKLAKLGFAPEWFVGAVTSGETTHAALAARSDPAFAALGRRCLHLTWGSRGGIQLDPALALQCVTDVEQADFVLAHGMEALTAPDGSVSPVSLDQIRVILAAAAARSLPLVIANPDVVTVDTTHLVPMPGQCGVWYKEAGGPAAQVIIMGKPAAVIYRAAQALAGGGRALAVGDSLAHDIAGAAGAGVDSLFVAGGIHAAELPATLTSEAVRQLAAMHACPAPTYATPMFAW
jgi:HAD superfamily hydrolase (TIGR01459 family)